MANQQPPVALVALDAPKRTKPSNYPEPFASQMQGREKRTIAGKGNGHGLFSTRTLGRIEFQSLFKYT
jgi:hypothetical protein